MSPQLEQLKWSLQALALPAELQLQQFPEFVVITDELMLEFDNWLQVAARQQKFSPEQQAALQQLDRLFDEMCQSDAADLVPEIALQQDSRWQEVRQLAGRALEAFGWSCEIPPKKRLVYFRGRDG